MSQYALLNPRTGKIVRIVAKPVESPPLGLICVPMPEIMGSGDSSWRLAAEEPPPALHNAEPPARHAFGGQPQIQAILERLATASAEHHVSLLLFEFHASERGQAEPVVRAALRVLGSALGADDGVGPLSDSVICVVLDHADVGVAQAVGARLLRHLSQLPGGWTARCLSYPADREEIERLHRG